MKNVLEYLENISNDNKVIDKNGSITYKDLQVVSKKIGSGLAKYVKNNDPVPVYMEKGIPCLEVFMGSLYAGGFYSLLNAGLPKMRLEQIISVLDVYYVVTDKEHLENAKEFFPNKELILYEDLVDSEIDDELLSNIRTRKLDVDPVYANFTSGSTGVPKGVVVGNRSIIDFIDNFTSTFGINETDIIANQAPFDFDVSVKDIYPALKTGATLVIVPKELFSRPAELIDFLVEHKVTTMTWAVSALCLISTFHGLDYKVPETVKRVMFSGEVMPMKHLKEWMKHLPNATFVNLYGPTEITCNCTYHIIDRNREYEKIPVGIPFNNEDVFLLDENNKLVVNSEIKGEICVRGSALALGYYKNKEQTDRAFVKNPLNDKYIEYIYRTGDLGYYENNDLYFGGRKDFQIKYMGHRIELEEIDKAIGGFEGVERVCSIFKEEKSRLYAFYIGDIEVKELHEKLSKELPVFMIPSKFVKLEEMPLTKNGKIDRKKLEEFI